MERIEVNTIFGKLSAEVSGDPNYPGIVICVEQQDEDGKYEKQLALAECTPNHPVESSHTLRLLVWNSESEDFTDDFSFLEQRSDEEPPEVIWKKYLSYLCEWASSHFGPGFYGMTPACFNEWLGCEYRQEMDSDEYI